MQEAVLVAARLCWMCWTYDQRDGMNVCHGCFAQGKGNARRMCAGKRRHGMDAAIDRAAAISLSECIDVRPYWCPVCQWWHVGGTGGIPRGYRKQRMLSAWMWVANVDPAELQAAQVEFGNERYREHWEATC